MSSGKQNHFTEILWAWGETSIYCVAESLSDMKAPVT
jgi:hypothetical protein